MTKKQAIITAAAALAAVYAGGTAYFNGHALPNTTFCGADASMKTEAELRTILDTEVNGKDIVITAADKNVTIPGAGILSVSGISNGNSILKGQNALSWPFSFFGSRTLTPEALLACDPDALTKALSDSGLTSYEKDPVDAVISEFQEGTGYSVIPDVNGWKADAEALTAAVSAKVEEGLLEMDLTEDFPVAAAVLADDAGLKKICDQRNALVGKDMFLTLGEKKIDFSGAVRNEWLTETEEGLPGFDVDMFYEYTKGLQEQLADDLNEVAMIGMEDSKKELVKKADETKAAALKAAEELKKAEEAAKGTNSEAAADPEEAKKALEEAEKAAEEAAKAVEEFKPDKKYIIDYNQLNLMLAAKLDVVLPEEETPAAKSNREAANKKIMNAAEKEAKNASSEEEKARILEEAEAKCDPGPGRVAVLRTAFADDVQGAPVVTDTYWLTEGLYIQNTPSEESEEQRKEKADKQYSAATRSEAMVESIEIETPESDPASLGMVETKVPENEIPIPVIEADPQFQLGYGMDYIEVDITKQHVWLFENGRKIMDSPCVTGLPTRDRSTHDGVFTVDYKQRNRILRGSQRLYASFVNYWMPFDGGIGLHDATWRASGAFGGEIYKYNGSHGCVNLPLSFVQKFYPRVYAGETVWVHH